LHIMLGGCDEDVDALIFEQSVESRRVEGRGHCRKFSSFVHIVSPGAEYFWIGCVFCSAFIVTSGN
jgi:hypothetical protein